MVQLIHTFASEAASSEEKSAGLFTALGIDWRMLVLQVIAFAVLVWILSKYVYPPLVAAIDKREKAIADSVAAATEAEAKAEQTQKEITTLFTDARTDATDIVANAQKEAANMVKDAEDKAKARADQIIDDARAKLDAEILKARKMLKEEAVTLIALATEKVVGEKLDDKKDASLIKNALGQEKA